MKIEGDAKLLRIFLGESDKSGAINVHERIVLEARKAGLAGATAYKGMMGFGKTSVIRTSKLFALSTDLPVVIEIVDSVQKIDDFIPLVKTIFEEADCGGLITIEKAEIIHYTSRKDNS
ncbi:MAG: hypothetical protein SCALA702_05480 [Melioribacteraceae bacterium]|nr:MAG: hypothetical protein SCALA702_05480 [Melioribacteraceae bacterium]